MKNTKFLLVIVLLFLLFECCTSTQKGKFPSTSVAPSESVPSSNSTDKRMKYLAQKAPSSTPEIFAPNIISKPNRYEFGCTFSKDGKELFFGVDNEGIMEIYHTQVEKNTWTAPEKLLSRDGFSNNDPMLSPDENRLYFISNRPLDPTGNKKDIDIWYVERVGKGWSQPINVGKPINSERDEYYVSFTENGTLYFSSKSKEKEAPSYAFDIYRSELKDGQYTEPEKLPAEINTNRYEADVFVAPDESYVIFCAIQRGGYGRGDLHISFKDSNGNWTPSVNMGPTVNTENHELCPFVSKDGKYLFFTSDEDLYWVSSEIINNYKAEISSDGWWQQLGYGKIIQIQGEQVKEYDICTAGCNLYEETLLTEMGKIHSFSSDSLTLKKNTKIYKFIRLDKIPEVCEQNKRNPKGPIYNFEILWNTFNEQYCYFEERKVDWNLIHQKYQAKITEETSELELYLIFDEMLSELNDGHVSMDVPENLEVAIQRIEATKTPSPASNESRISTFDLSLKAQAEIANFYCEHLKYHNGGIAKWGMMKNNIGYIQINAMLLLAYYDLPDSLGLKELAPLYWPIAAKRPFQRQDEIDGANRLMDEIVKDLSDAKALILDLRFNVGGKDEAALGIIGHFVNQRIIVARKKAKLGKGFTNHQTIYLEPKKPNFLGDVHVLTSHETASAAELASLSTLRVDNITRIGSSTEGIFSDGLDKKLPNGWEYTLSNEIYEDTNGNSYENIGVPPDISVHYPKDSRAFYNLLIHQIAENGDVAIERAFKLQKK